MIAAASDAAAAIVLRDVDVTFGTIAALRHVDLSVAVGERVALVGPSGAGKSSLLGLLNGSVAPTSGSVSVLGAHPYHLSGRELRRLRTRIAMVHQQLDLVGPLRVVHNVNAGRVGRWSLPRSAWSLLRPYDVDGAVAALARVGLADRVFDRTDELSGGQQQRVALARAVVQDPELVLADEPVSSLDPGLAAQVLALLTEVAAEHQRTLVVSLHEPALAQRYCDRLVGLREGQIVFDAPSTAVTTAMLGELYRTGR